MLSLFDRMGQNLAWFGLGAKISPSCLRKTKETLLLLDGQTDRVASLDASTEDLHSKINVKTNFP